MKKILLILFILILGSGIVVLGIWFRSKKNEATPETNPQSSLPVDTGTLDIPRAEISPDAQGLPATGSNEFGVVTQSQIFDYALDARNHVFVAARDGSVVEIANGKENVLYKAVAPVPISASFSYDGKKILASFGDPTEPQWSIFDVAAGSWKPLPPGILRPTWSPNDYRIAYFAPQGTRFTIYILDLGSRIPKPQAIFSISASSLALLWDLPGYIFLSEAPTGFAMGSVWKLDIQKKLLEPVVLDQLGANVAWSKENNTGLAFTSGGRGSGGTLTVINGSGEVKQKMNIVTLPEKCTFYIDSEKEDEKSAGLLLCAIPREVNEFSLLTLPDDYHQKTFFPSDDIRAINLTTGMLTPVFENASFKIDAHKLKVFGGIVFFIDRRDMRLYAASLKSILPQ